MSDMSTIALLVLLFVLLMLLLKKRGRKKQTDDVVTLKSKKVRLVDRIDYKRAFLRLQKVPLLRRYMHNLCNIFESYFPDDKDSVHRMSVLVLLGSSSCSVLVFLICILVSPSFYTMLCSFVIIFIINKEIIDGVTDRLDKIIIEQLDNFIELLQFNYAQSKMIDEALHDSICGKNRVLEKHAKSILDVLNADDLDGALSVYLQNVHNAFLKELMCICVVVHEYGDTIRDGESCFLRNLVKLKNKLGLELNNMALTKNAFVLHTFLTIPPIFCSIFLISWGTKTIPELEPYLNSFYGFMVKILVPIASLVVYFIIKRLKSRGDVDLSDHQLLNTIVNIPIVRNLLVRYYDNNYGRKIITDKMLKKVGSKLTTYTLMVKRILFAVCGMLVTFCIIVGLNYSTRYRIRNEIVGDSSKTSAASEEVSVEMLMLIRAYTDQYLSVDILKLYKEETDTVVTEYNAVVRQWLQQIIEQDLLTNSIEISDKQALMAAQQYNTEHANTTRLYLAYLGTKDGQIREENEAMYEMGVEQLKILKDTASQPKAIELSVLRNDIATDVVNNVINYNTACINWLHVLLTLISSMFFFQIPYLWITLNKSAMQQMMQNEVMQFQALILILSAEKRMSVDVILDWMLKFSVIFHSSLHKCVVEFPESEEQALKQLLADETFEPFQSLIRNLMMCDNVGIMQAFNSLEVTQNNYVESVKIKLKQRIQSNSQVSMLLIFFLFGFVIITNMAYPLSASATRQLNTTMGAMSEESE